MSEESGRDAGASSGKPRIHIYSHDYTKEEWDNIVRSIHMIYPNVNFWVILKGGLKRFLSFTPLDSEVSFDMGMKQELLERLRKTVGVDSYAFLLEEQNMFTEFLRTEGPNLTTTQLQQLRDNQDNIAELLKKLGHGKGRSK